MDQVDENTPQVGGFRNDTFARQPLVVLDMWKSRVDGRPGITGESIDAYKAVD
jgi:hypothetical protein